GLDGPGVGPVGCRKVVVSGLVVVDEQAVAATGEDPRHREVRRVVARTKPGRRQDAADERAVVVDPGPVRHVALHTRASVLYRVGAFAETIEMLVRDRGPGRTDAEHLLGASAGRRLELDDALSGRPDAQRDGATRRVV